VAYTSTVHNRPVVQVYSQLYVMLNELEAYRKKLWCGLCCRNSKLRRAWYKMK